MAYVSPNFKTKKALKDAVAAGKDVTVFCPAGIFPLDTSEGNFTIEGPHYPQPHKWYARVEVVNYQVISVR